MQDTTTDDRSNHIARVLGVIHRDSVDEANIAEGEIMAYWDASYVSGGRKPMSIWTDVRATISSCRDPLEPEGDGAWISLSRMEYGSERRIDECMWMSAIVLDADVGPEKRHATTAEAVATIMEATSALYAGLEACLTSSERDNYARTMGVSDRARPQLWWTTSHSGGVQAAIQLDQAVSGEDAELLMETIRELLLPFIRDKRLDDMFQPNRLIRLWDVRSTILGDSDTPLLPSEPLLRHGREIRLQQEQAIRDRAETEQTRTGISPGDFLSENTGMLDVLAKAGWKQTRRKPGQHGASWTFPLTRPGKDVSEGRSATLWRYKDSGRQYLHVFTDSVPYLSPGGYSMLGLLASMTYKKDVNAMSLEDRRSTLSRMAKEISERSDYKTWRKQREHDMKLAKDDMPMAELSKDEQRQRWEPTIKIEWPTTDVEEEVPPTIGDNGQGGGLFVEGTINTIMAHPSVGKSWFVIYQMLVEARKGRPSIYLDFEDRLATYNRRLLALGATAEDLKYMAYVSMKDGAIDPRDGEYIADNFKIVAIDSAGEAIEAADGSSNTQDDVSAWFNSFLGCINAPDVTILLIEHLQSNADGGTRKPIGSIRKLAAVTGAVFRLDIRQFFDRETAGSFDVVSTKDRNGFFAPMKKVCTVTVTPLEGKLDFKVTPPLMTVDELLPKEPKSSPPSKQDVLAASILQRIRRIEVGHPTRELTVSDVTEWQLPWEYGPSGPVPAATSYVRRALQSLVARGDLIEVREGRKGRGGETLYWVSVPTPPEPASD